MINVRTKGQEGERDICKFFNEIYKEVYDELAMVFPEKDIAQRNQNQSAVGGCDIDHTCHYAVEVKRQEQLSINTWWKQCEKSAWECGKYPILIFKQNRKPWRVILYVNQIRLYGSEPVQAIRAEISMDDFRNLFKKHALEYIRTNGSAV